MCTTSATNADQFSACRPTTATKRTHHIVQPRRFHRRNDRSHRRWQSVADRHCSCTWNLPLIYTLQQHASHLQRGSNTVRSLQLLEVIKTLYRVTAGNRACLWSPTTVLCPDTGRYVPHSGLQVPRARTTIGRRSFAVAEPSLWNSLRLLYGDRIWHCKLSSDTSRSIGSASDVSTNRRNIHRRWQTPGAVVSFTWFWHRLQNYRLTYLLSLVSVLPLFSTDAWTLFIHCFHGRPKRLVEVSFQFKQLIRQHIVRQPLDMPIQLHFLHMLHNFIHYKFTSNGLILQLVFACDNYNQTKDCRFSSLKSAFRSWR